MFMRLKIHPKMEYNGTKYSIFGSDHNMNVVGFSTAFSDLYNLVTQRSIYMVGIPTEELDWKFHLTDKFEPRDDIEYEAESYRGKEYCLISFSDNVKRLSNYEYPTGWFGIFHNKNWDYEKMKNIEGLLTGPKQWVPIEDFLGKEEDQGYTEGYKLGYSGLRWL